MKIVLASASPRRSQLLKMMGIEDFTVIADTSDEHLTPGLSPEQQVCKLSVQKAQNVSLLCNQNDLLIAADTLVYLDGRPLGKPTSQSDARDMLRRLSGRAHSVYTGVTLLKNDKHSSHAEKTDVFFRELSENEILRYVNTGEPMDKAGAYAIQEGAASFARRIEGDFFNIMGLPLCRLSIMLKDFGVEPAA